MSGGIPLRTYPPAQSLAGASMNLHFMSASRASPQARLILAIGAVAAGLASQSALAQTYLGTNQPFAVMGATAVTCVVSSTVTGDLGISPNGAASITGYPVPPCNV